MYKSRLVFISACSCMMLFGIGLITLGSVATDLRVKFHLDTIASGTLFSILPIGILTASLFFGPLCDKYGYKKLLVISILLMFIGFEGIAYAPSYSMLKACIFCIGLGGGALNGGTNAVVSDISLQNKSANLSLLGVSYGIGALGMPFIMGVLENHFSFEAIVASVGFLTLLVGLFIILIKFPAPKQSQGFPIKQSFVFFRDPLLILIAFFLFCQSSFEAIINNWITTYLIQEIHVQQNKALYALSLFVAGITVMRLLTGSIFRKAPVQNILYVSFALIFTGCMLLRLHLSFNIAILALVLLGAGLAGGFPIMLSFVGNRYKELSATAFSFVFVIALVGNMLINYIMGPIVHTFGVKHLVSVALIELAVMVLLGYIILKKQSNKL